MRTVLLWLVSCASVRVLTVTTRPQAGTSKRATQQVSSRLVNVHSSPSLLKPLTGRQKGAWMLLSVTSSTSSMEHPPTCVAMLETATQHEAAQTTALGYIWCSFVWGCHLLAGNHEFVFWASVAFCGSRCFPQHPVEGLWSLGTRVPPTSVIRGNRDRCPCRRLDR